MRRVAAELEDSEEVVEKRLAEEEQARRKLQTLKNIINCYIHIFGLRFNKNGLRRPGSPVYIGGESETRFSAYTDRKEVYRIIDCMWRIDKRR